MMQSSHSSADSSSGMAPSQSSANTASNSANDNDPDTKILQDLGTLSEQIALCQSMLLTNRRRLMSSEYSDSDNNNAEALLTVIGFLEACAPRMLELIEIAAQGGGVLRDETFEECLVVNDKLTTILADLDNPPQNNNDSGGIGAAATTATASTDAAASSGGGVSSTPIESDAIDIGMQNLSMGCWDGAGRDIGRDEVVGGKTTGLDDSEDLLGIGLDDHDLSVSATAPLPPPPTAFSSDSTKEAPAASGDDNDDFDTFFRDRTSAP